MNRQTIRAHNEDLLFWERKLWNTGFQFIAGIDEAGRGPLAGPVVAAAVVFSPEPCIPGVNDSKRIVPSVRQELALAIEKQALGIGVGIVTEKEIDLINIRQASLLAMRLAVENLQVLPDFVLVDGKDIPDIPIQAQPIIKGDRISFSIAAASIIAKVIRDRMMVEFHNRYPKFGFDRHKGYATRDHLRALQLFGPCSIHRCSFKLIRSMR